MALRMDFSKNWINKKEGFRPIVLKCRHDCGRLGDVKNDLLGVDEVSVI